jgi:polyisoprenoid-binding protein YceI
MHRRILPALIVLAAAFSAKTAVADDYKVDPVHSAVSFKVGHLGIGWIHGRFNKVSGEFTIDGNSSSFGLTIKADSVDTGNVGRDGHLKSPDFFNAKQFPLITFKSTAVKKIDDGYEVVGDLTMHGKTNSITMNLTGGKTIDFKGKQLVGFSTQLSLKRTDYGMTRLVPAAGDEVRIDISLEGMKK